MVECKLCKQDLGEYGFPRATIIKHVYENHHEEYLERIQKPLDKIIQGLLLKQQQQEEVYC